MSASVYSHALLFDTNVFNLITPKGKERHYQKLFSDLNTKLNPSRCTSFLSFVTPLLLLEYLGVQPSSFPKIELMGEAISEKPFVSAPPYVFKKASEHFARLRELGEDSLRERHERQLEYSSEDAKALVRDIVRRITSKDGFTKLIKQQLALDHTYGFNFGKWLKEDDLQRVHLNSLLDIFRSFERETNITSARGVFEVTEHLRKLSKGKDADPKALEAMKSKDGLKLFGDRGDLDILHLAVIGAFLDDIHYPVLVFTADPKEALLKRLTSYKTLVHHLTNLVFNNERAEIREAFPRFAPRNGKIALVDSSSGAIDSVIEVGAIEIVP